MRHANESHRPVNVVFKDKALAELYASGKTAARKYKRMCRNGRLVEGYQRAVSIMYDVESTDDLRPFSFLHYERLRHQRRPLSSVRLANGMVERLIFAETEDGVEVELIEINDTHYGDKK